MIGPRDDWDDDRLAAAFAARADRAPGTPADLAVDVRSRLAGVRGASTSRFRHLAPAFGLAAAVVVVAIVGFGQLHRTDPSASIGPSGGAIADVLAHALSVRDAIAVRDARSDDREIAVTAFVARYTTLGCPAPDFSQALNPTRLTCPAFATWLLDAPEVLETRSGDTITGHPPTGPSIQPSFAVAMLPNAEAAVDPVRLTLIGHFDDRRAALCVPADRPACSDTFVVDRVAEVDGAVLPIWTTVFGGPPPRSAVGDIDRAVSSAAPAVAILSRRLVGPEIQPIGDVEPALRGDARWTSERAVWIVTTVEPEGGRAQSRTFLVVDGTTSVFEMTAAGPVPLVAGPGPTSSAPTTPGPEVAISPGEALATRDASTEAGEIRVTGWIRGGIPVPCPAPFRPANPTRLDCTPAQPWIVESRDDAGPGQLNAPPAGPAFQPSFALVDTDAYPALQPGGGGSGTDPLEVTITGHFHDRRAILCDSSDCFSTFVVDRIDRVGGTEIGVRNAYALSVPVERGTTTSSVELLPPISADELDPVIQHLSGIANGLEVINRRVMSVTALLDVEPGLADEWSGIGTARVVTSITAIETGAGSGPPIPRTFLFPDRGAVLFEMTPDGPVTADNVPVQSFPDLRSRVGDPITVSAAIDRRDHALDGTELLVGGWSWAPGAISCTPLLSSQPVLDQCPSDVTWLVEDQPAARAGNALQQPSGPAMNLVIPPESANLAPLGTTPSRVAVLGHFDDHRAGTCPNGQTDRCRRNFVVDAILDPARLALEPALAATVHPAPSNTPKGTASWAADVAGLPEADRPDRLISVFPVAVAALGTLEPELAGVESLAGVDIVWLLHFLDQDGAGNPIVRTRLVVDATPRSGVAAVFDVTADGLSPALPATR